VKLDANDIPRYIDERTLLVQRFLRVTITQSYRFFNESSAPIRVIAQLLFMFYCYLSDFIVILFHLLLLPFLIGLYPVFYSGVLVLWYPTFASTFWRSPSLFDFPFFAIFASRLSSILFTWSLHNCFLILTHLMISWIPQILRMFLLRIPHRILPLIHLKVLSIDLNRRFVMIVFLLASLALITSFRFSRFYISSSCSLSSCTCFSKLYRVEHDCCSGRSCLHLFF